MTEPAEVASRILALAEDGLRGIERTISAWPSEFRVIIWETVASLAAEHAKAAREGLPLEKST